MTTLALITLLRIIPYAIVLYFAVVKGYRWLATTMVWLFFVLGFNYFLSPTEEVRAILGSVFGFLILLHVLDLKHRGGDK